MSRKDYRALAEALGGVLARATGATNTAGWVLECVDAVAVVLAKDNALFRRGQFVDAVHKAAEIKKGA